MPTRKLWLALALCAGRGTRRIPIRGFAAVVAAFAAGSASAQVVIHVPADVPTIQRAIASAAPGDAVLVAPGTYAEHLDFLGKAIIVASSDGPGVTTIDGGATATVVTFRTGERTLSVLRGFTITRSATAAPAIDGGGIAISNASPTIEGNVITTVNHACAIPGISISFGSPVVRNNTIRDNGQVTCPGGLGGGGIQIAGAASAQILGNIISGNGIGADGGGIALFAAGTPVIRGNTIMGNSAVAQGGGISMFNQADTDITDNVIAGNSAFQGGGIAWLVPSGDRGPFVVNNTIVDNVATNGGSGIFADGFDMNAQVVNNIIVASAGQTAIQCGDFDRIPPAIQANDVVAAAPGVAYGGICADQTGKNGNVSVDPLFVNRAGGDFHLQLTSPVIDAGTNAAAALPSLDRDGNSRVVDGDASCAATVDMGAYEVLLAPALTFSPPSISFADQVVGSTGAPQAVTLTNPGTRAVRICSMAASGDFAQTSHCGPALAAGASCTIDVRFAPTAVGARGGSIFVADAAANSPHAITLSGKGLEPPQIVIVPGSATVAPRGAASFSVAGGSGQGYTWSLRSNPSGASIDATGAYVAGPHGGVTDVVSVADSLGATATARVTVTGESDTGGCSHGGDGGWLAVLIAVGKVRRLVRRRQSVGLDSVSTGRSH